MFKGLFVIFLLTIAVCVARTPDSEECDAQRKCKEPFTSCIEGYCEHKGVFPAEWQEVLGASLLFVTTAMCNAAGISGGGIIVTIGIGLFYLSSKEAVAMSNVLIFFGCVTRFTINFKQRHPLKDATSIDYGVVTCQLPLVMLGTFLGVQLNELLAETLIFILLFLTFAALTYRSFRKGIDVSKREKREKKERAKCLDETRLLTDHPQVESISSIKETEEYKE
ncbi:unnamed protein product [Moneuplotes crassus]|uniref:Uncharacterized protein n=1 Tax=Euplotes crassus TaxID=5936 RepID=A0AAD1X6W0_EUPCR|nr:unnamed protein product [Moneuplotes crassus]